MPLGGVSLGMMKKQSFLALLVTGMLAQAGPLSAITTQEQTDILFMKQEEKLARDVYTTLYEAHGLQIFANIATSEQRHMNAVDYLIRTFALTDTTPLETGIFTYDELNTLYAESIAKGNLSAVDALEVGVTIEEADIEDLENALETNEDVTIRNVFGNLLRGSQNHLQAFQNNLTAGVDSCLGTPQIRFGQNAQGGVSVDASAACQGTQRYLQCRSSGGNGQGQGRGGQWGNAQGNGSCGNASVECPNQYNVNCDPSNPIQLRLRDSSCDQVCYSNVLNTRMINTPWPNAERIGQGWFATWMGDVYIKNYPLVYIERFGWITIQSFENGEVVWSDEDGNTYMTTEEKYPSYFDYQLSGWI